MPRTVGRQEVSAHSTTNRQPKKRAVKQSRVKASARRTTADDLRANTSRANISHTDTSRMRRPAVSYKQVDVALLVMVVILAIFGLVMVFSASAPSANQYQGSPYYYLTRQAIFAVAGFISMIFLSYFDYHRFGKLAFIILLFSFLLLFAVYIPGVGIERNGARRWIDLGISTLQPSEVVKVGIIIYFAYSLSKIGDDIKQFFKGLSKYLVILGLFAGVLLLEPHLSGTIVICATATVMLIIAGARMRHFMMLGIPVIPALGYLILTEPYMLKRVTAFMNPFADTSDTTYQIIQSLYAIGSGGLFGLGLGLSRQKFLYLPEPQNDFIFAIICEELGLMGALLVIGLFCVLIWRGYRIAQQAPDKFGTLLAAGITTLVAIQVSINIAVVTSSVPVTGMALPFFSSGGTSLFILMSCMGILLNISRQTREIN